MNQRMIVQMIVRNEEDRYLKTVLKEISRTADLIMVLDDGSTDRTVEICRSFPKTRLETSSDSQFEKDESKLRTRLWEMVREVASEDTDWILTLDADEVFEDSFHERLPELLSSTYDWISFHLFDMWNKKEYRVDGYWSPVITRLFRYKNVPFNISGEIHCKNIPRYVYESNNGFCCSDIALRHLGYLREEDREKKYAFYGKKSIGLDYIHTLSIMDPPKLKKVNGYKYNKKILITSLIRDREWCLKPFLEGIFNLDYPKEYISFYFIVNDSKDNSLNMLNDWKNLVKKYYNEIIIEERNFGSGELKEHDWDDQKLHNMSVMRNQYLKKARDEKVDFVFVLDSDVLIKDPYLLKHLLNLDRDVIGELHWAKWEKFDNPLPNAWIQGQYDITEKFMELLKRPSCYPVGGICGCVLISKDVIDSSVDYTRIYNLPQEVRGEDRFFCINAQAHKFTIWCDTCYPCEHMERSVEYRIKEIKKKSRNRISLCMIAKNEEIYIEQAVKSVKDIVDQVVIVDTGSTDKTKEIISNFGNIIEYNWEDDFSKARNLGLSLSDGEWILQLDPDEYVLPQDRLKILDMAQDTSIDAYLFCIKNFLEDPAKNPNAKFAISESYRLFKRNPQIFYNGIIHEGIERQLEEIDNVKVVASPVYIWHFGYLKNKKNLEDKHNYYAELYKRRIEKNYNDTEAHMSLALHYLFRGNTEKATNIYSKVLKIEPNWRAFHNLGVIKREEGCFNEALSFLMKAKENMPENINPLYRNKMEDNLKTTKRNLLSDIIA